jgi:aminoglycoside/choline kinase family phosphotransferase
MDDRQQQLLDWARKKLGAAAQDGQWQVVAGDASSRRYFRYRCAQGSWICVDSPPSTEKNREFLDIRVLLERGGIRVPSLHGLELEKGFLLLGDLGKLQMLDLLDGESAKPVYTKALDVLFRLQQIEPLAGQLPAYRREILAEELSRFPEWFCEGLLGITLDAADRDILDRYFSQLIDSALEQPQVLVHRDFHSRNLMPQADGELGVIDFQDAIKGPISYDLVSLLRDCYVSWPPSQVETWLRAYWKRMPQLKLRDLRERPDLPTFRRWFDWMGLQRHTKVLGNFSRLALRDEKPAYLQDLPQVVFYIEDVLKEYPELEEFHNWFRDRLGSQIAAQPWSGKK